MPKGQTNQPLDIQVLDFDLYEAPEIQALITSGHTVTYVPSAMPDVILGRGARYMTKDLVKHLATTIKAIRADKRKKKGEK